MAQVQVFVLTLLVASMLSVANADVLRCIDSHEDILAHPSFSYGGGVTPVYCENSDDPDCIPEVLEPPTDGKDHKGFIVFKGSASLEWTQPSREDTYEYVYLRYRAKKASPISTSIFYLKGVTLQGTSQLPPSYSGDLKWKEVCYRMKQDATNPRQIFVEPESAEEYMVIDKIIVVAQDSAVACSATSYPVIKNMCNDVFWPPAPTTSTHFPSTLPPTSPPEKPQPLIEWVDVESDLHNKFDWFTSKSMKYAFDTFDLPSEVSQDLPAATGLFYFQGRPEEGSTVQGITRLTPNTGEAHLHIRYYIHHKNPADTQHYYVSPVQNKFQGVQYLDATPDFKWKEVFLSLDVDDSWFSFQIGTTNAIGDQDLLIIDKIIFMERPSD